VRLNDLLKLRKKFLNKFIFCFLSLAVLLPCRNIYSQEEKAKTDSVFIKKHSPVKAQLYSAILPGLGQIYNRKYWKIPIIYGIGGAVIFSYFYNRDYYEDLNNAYIEVYYMDPPPTSYEFRGKLITYNIAGQLYREKERFRKYKDYALVGIAAVYLLNVIDAMIDAHFLEYDVSDDLSMRLGPTLIKYDFYASTMGIRFCVKF
jgi:hypothetical protein